MAEVKFQGALVKTVGELPAIGTSLPGFSLVKTDLSEVSERDFPGKKIILNIVPSIDTGVCSKSMREFEQKIKDRSDVIVLGISADLPFAIARHSGEQKLENIIGVSGFRSDFGKNYGILIAEGPLKNLYARAIVVANSSGEITHTELVPEITTEPNYGATLG